MTPNLLQSPNQAQFQPDPLSRGSLNITQGPTFGIPSASPTPAMNMNNQTSSPVKMTQSGGVSFSPTAATGFNSAPVVSATPKPSLSSFISNTSPTPNGGSITSNQGGAVTGHTPAPQFNIDTSGSVPSSALTQSTSMADTMAQHSQYQDYVNALAQAQGYNPSYIQAYQQQQQAQTQGAQLGLNAAALNSNLYTGNNLPGDTMNYAQGATAKALAQNTLQQSENQIQQLSANQALNTQQLSRTGNISAAQTQLQSSPEGMAGQNAINQYNSLQQSYPGANIPEYNQSLTPEQNQQVANYIVSNSPAYKSQFQSTFATPGGGTGIYSKLDLTGLQQNQDGSYNLVPAAAAALGSANANVVNTQLGNLSNINSAINASQKTLQTTQQFMNQYGLNQSGVSLLSQIQNSTNKNLDKAGAVAGLNADLNALRSDYAQYLVGRGGSVAGTNDEAAKAIPDTISPAQLQVLVQQMQQDGQNAAEAVSNQVNTALQGLKGGQQTQQGSGSVWDF